MWPLQLSPQGAAAQPDTGDEADILSSSTWAKGAHRSAQYRGRRKHSLFLPFPPAGLGDSAGCLTWELAAVLQRDSETEARPLPAIRAGGGGGRMQCPGSQQQLVPATAPRGHVVPGCSTCSRDYGNHRCKSAFVLPESRRPRSIPVPCGGTSQSRTPFPRAVTCGHVSCTGRGDGFPPSPVSQGLLPPYHVGAAPGDRAVTGVCHRPHRCLASAPCSLQGQKG